MAVTKTLPHFEVDKAGLAKVLARRDKAFIATELISNAWDESATQVHVTLEWLGGKAKIVVEDDSPEGFADLKDAWTLFKESRKKVNAVQRGRFNVGEKFVLAVCETASIETTTGTVLFDKKGRRLLGKKRKSGSVFTGVLKMTRAEYDHVVEVVRTLIAPEGIATTFNLVELPAREPVLRFIETLRTEIADEDGNLRPSSRKATVELHELLPGETATIYELGIPVVETGDRYHVNVMQKVPLTTDRDNVTPGYLRDLRTYVLNNSYALMSAEDFNAGWVIDALQDERVDPKAVQAAMVGKFGEKAVAYDPSDPEANKIAVEHGYTVVPGGSLPKAAWKQIKQSGAVLPAGKVTPSPGLNLGDGPEMNTLNPEHYPATVERVVEFSKVFAKRLIGAEITVEVVNEAKQPFQAAYGEHRLMLNVGRLGFKWFSGPVGSIIDLLIHEFGHEFCSDHLDRKYLNALTMLAGRAVKLALEDPDLYAVLMGEAVTA